MKKGIHIVNLNKQQQKYVTVLLFYSIFIRSSCWKPEIQNDLPKITKSSEFAKKQRNKSGHKFLTMFNSSCFNNYSIEFLKMGKLKSKGSGGIRTRNPWVLRLRNTCAIGCAKKTAENVFKCCIWWLCYLSASVARS